MLRSKWLEKEMKGSQCTESRKVAPAEVTLFRTGGGYFPRVRWEVLREDLDQEVRPAYTGDGWSSCRKEGQSRLIQG